MPYLATRRGSPENIPCIIAVLGNSFWYELLVVATNTLIVVKNDFLRHRPWDIWNGVRFDTSTGGWTILIEIVTPKKNLKVRRGIQSLFLLRIFPRRPKLSYKVGSYKKECTLTVERERVGSYKKEWNLTVERERGPSHYWWQLKPTMW